MAGQVERLYPQDMLWTGIVFITAVIVIYLITVALGRMCDKQRDEKITRRISNKRWMERMKKGGFKIL